MGAHSTLIRHISSYCGDLLLLNINQYLQFTGMGGIACHLQMVLCHDGCDAARGREVAWCYHDGKLHYVSLGMVGEVGEGGCGRVLTNPDPVNPGHHCQRFTRCPVSPDPARIK